MSPTARCLLDYLSMAGDYEARGCPLMADHYRNEARQLAGYLIAQEL